MNIQLLEQTFHIWNK